MITQLKEKLTPNILLGGNFGLEREGLRVNIDGTLASTLHPKSFGEKHENPYITTDFSESQLEVITPPLKNVNDVYNFTNALYDIVSLEIGEEILWPESMPCIIPNNDYIPVAEIEGDGKEYREYLLKKYGGKKQLISGLHYNFSFDEELIKVLHENSNLSYMDFRNEVYLKVSRNYLRYRFLLIYLLGASPVVHKSFRESCKCSLDNHNNEYFTNEGAISYRNGTCGYRNMIDLFPSYESIGDYINSIQSYIDDNVIISHKELYSQVRLKPYDTSNFFDSLKDKGVSYLEYRSIDVNPFEKGGISLEDLKFMQIFNLYLLFKEETDYKCWQQESLKNQDAIARNGLKKVFLLKDGKRVLMNTWANDILTEMKELNDTFSLGLNKCLDNMINKINNPKLTYAYKISEMVKENGYIDTFIDLGKKYKEDAYKNRFKLEGYEDLELSTQILLKESIKHGIKFEVLDRKENFISLSKGNKTEYVKEATKTSKDSYSTVLIMEDKNITKVVLDKNNINVPKGDMFYSLDDAKLKIKSYINIPVVIKPKSTNFGKGVVVLKDGGSLEDLYKALEIAFSFDEVVLVEEYLVGEEFRFLVIDYKVSGILRRVPANVSGDGVSTIKELVEIKNLDSLRGYKYKTPLEKIVIDDTVKLLLKKNNMTIDYIPRKDEIVYLRENSNISTGGDSIDYTDDIPEKFKEIAIKSAKAVGARICGVDMIIENYKESNSKYGIVELNFNPAIHIHCFPYKGTERNIGVEILDLLNLI